MADGGDARIEALEHQLMRAWGSADRKTLRGLLSRQFRMVIGAAAPVLLDRKSLVEAAGGRWRLDGYRFGQTVYAREMDGVALFAAELEMEGAIEGQKISGRWWQADLWRRSGLPRRWRLQDRQLARLETDRQLSDAIRALQLWRQ